MWRAVILATTFLGVVSSANAHYHILLPQYAYAERDKAVSFILEFGHPFEHQLFDTSKPDKLVVVSPDGKTADLRTSLKRATIKNSEQKDVAIYRFTFVPRQRGDFSFVAEAAPVWMAEEQMFLKDAVRVTLHVLSQKGWDNSLGQGFEMVPLTRPYGLQPGMVFQAQALFDGKPVSRSLVEIERMNPAPPKDLPADEQITRTVRTDPNGIATCTVIEPGWWSVTARREAGTLDRDGKMFPVRERSTLWVYVDEKLQAKDTK
jgi:cobalt/nickel transport protein